MTLTFTRPRDLKLDEPGYATGSAGSWDKPHVGYYDLPYGLWLSDNGREVLFNRHYRALWWRMPDGPCRPGEGEALHGALPGRELPGVLVH